MTICYRLRLKPSSVSGESFSPDAAPNVVRSDPRTNRTVRASGNHPIDLTHDHLLPLEVKALVCKRRELLAGRCAQCCRWPGFPMKPDFARQAAGRRLISRSVLETLGVFYK